LGLKPGTISNLAKEDRRGWYQTVKIRQKVPFIVGVRREQKVRVTFKPCKDLRDIQLKIRDMFFADFVPHAIAHAYVKGERGTISNAKAHLGANAMLHIDLIDFFGSITLSMVIKAFRKYFKGFTSTQIYALADLCCYKGFLPQGSPIAPLLSNLVCYPLDEELDRLAQTFGCTVTRYSDNIYFSTKASRLPRDLGEVLYRDGLRRVRVSDPFCALIERHAFEINYKKVKIEARSEGLEMVGLMVGDRITVPSACRRGIRTILANWKKHGLEAVARAHRPAKKAGHFAAALRSWIGYVGYVMGKDDPQYRTFLETFETLRARDLALAAPLHEPQAPMSWLE